MWACAERCTEIPQVDNRQNPARGHSFIRSTNTAECLLCARHSGTVGYRMSSVPGVDRVEECRHVETGGTKGQDLGVVQGDPDGDLKDTGELAKLALGEGGRRVGEKEDKTFQTAREHVQRPRGEKESFQGPEDGRVRSRTNEGMAVSRCWERGFLSLSSHTFRLCAGTVL